MLKDLTFLEKIKLKCRAHRDVADQKIELVSVISDQNPVTGDADRMLFSAFLQSELMKFAVQRDQTLGTIRVRFWLHNASYAKDYSRKALPRAIADIDNQINVYSTRIDLLADTYTDKLGELDRMRKMHEAACAEHLVQMCVNRAERYRLEYAELTNDLYIGIIELLGQKKELLDEVSGKLTALRSEVYRRILYYCEVACTINAALDPGAISPFVYERYADMDILQQYSAVRADAQEQLDHYRTEFSKLNNWN